MASGSCNIWKFFVIENFFTRIVKHKQTIFQLRNEFEFRKLSEKNVHFTPYCAEIWLLVLIEVVNRTKIWIESVSQ